jgi:hypothetical protein
MVLVVPLVLVVRPDAAAAERPGPGTGQAG